MAAGKALKACVNAVTGCANLTESGACPSCRALKSQERGSAAARGYGPRWKRVRLAFLRERCPCSEEEGYPLASCQICRGTGLKNRFCRDIFNEHGQFLEIATEVDHKIPHKGNPELMWNRANYQPLCRTCHAKKTNSERHGIPIFAPSISPDD